MARERLASFTLMLSACGEHDQRVASFGTQLICNGRLSPRSGHCRKQCPLRQFRRVSGLAGRNCLCTRGKAEETALVIGEVRVGKNSDLRGVPHKTVG